MVKYIQPQDPSLALCQICANCGEIMIPVFQDGEYHRFPTCTRYVTGDCNDFVPLRTDSLEWKKRELTWMSRYGRFD